MNTPLVSVIMPAYNSENYIKSAIDSVLAQTYGNFELILINDCSTDSTLDIMNEYAKKDARITVVSNKVNSGVSFSRNRTIMMSEGEYVAFIDSDDIWAPEKLEKQLELIASNPDAVLVYTASGFIKHDGSKIDFILHVPEKISRKELLKQNIISCSSVLVKRSCIEGVKMPDDRMHEDFATWLKILKSEKYAYGIDEPLLIYRISKNSKSSNKLKAALMTWRVYKHAGLSFFERLYYMQFYASRSLKKYTHIFKK